MNRALTVLAFVTLAAPAAVRADEASAVDRARADAQVHNKAGVARLARGDHAGALAEFEDAYARFPSPKILLNIAAALQGLGRPADAANTYQRWLDDPGADPARRAEVTTILASLDTQAGQLTIVTSEPDAEVQIEGLRLTWQASATAPWIPAGAARGLRVPPGDFRVKARRGGASAEKTGTIAAGAKRSLELTLFAEKPTPRSSPPSSMAPSSSASPAPGPQTPIAAARASTPEPSPATIAMVTVDVLVDAAHHGGAAAPGVLLRVFDRVDITARVLVGPTLGGSLGAALHLGRGRLRPLVSFAVPVFASSGPRWSLRGAAGLELGLGRGRRIGVLAEIGAEHVLNPEMDRAATVLVPTLGLRARR